MIAGIVEKHEIAAGVIYLDFVYKNLSITLLTLFFMVAKNLPMTSLKIIRLNINLL